MLGALGLIVVIVTSGAFAALYAFRLHHDYLMYILGSRAGPARASRSYRLLLALFFLTFWLGHALAIGVSREVNQQIISVLSAALNAVAAETRNYVQPRSIVIAMLLIAVSLSIKALRIKGGAEKASRIVRQAKTQAFGHFTNLLTAAGIGVLLLALVNVFSAINEHVLNASPALSEFIGAMLVCASLTALMGATFVFAVSRLAIDRPLSRRREDAVTSERPGSSETSDDPAAASTAPPRTCEWRKIRRSIRGNHLKEAVWYAMTFTFVPCLLLRWAVFLPTLPASPQAPYLAVLANLHIMGFAVGGLLDWIELGRLRTYAHRRSVFPHDWQVDADIQFTTIKDVGILIPVALLSWGYLFWSLAVAIQVP